MRVDYDTDAPAVIQGDTAEVLTYRQLGQRVEARQSALAQHEVDLAFLVASLDLATVIDYLALQALEVPTVLLDPGLSHGTLASLIDRYAPSAILGGELEVEGYVSVSHADSVSQRLSLLRAERIGWDRSACDEMPAILLLTSGSTGNPKLVQLTDANISSNSADIVEALRIDESERGLNHLPLFYSYGLSILNSHLHLGAATILTASSPLRPEFWKIVDEQRVTSIPGVPYSYEMYRRVGMLDMHLPTLRYMTQAGGKLAKESVVAWHAGLEAKGCEFRVMYGQTEAAPRMSVLPSEDLPTYAGSVGFALRSGRFTIDQPDEDGCGEVLFDGPNVMLGYAMSRAELGIRSQHGPLATGDIGRLDVEGRLYLTGRLKRMAKLFGHRMNLDDIEAHFVDLGPVAAVEGRNSITVFVEGDLEPAAEVAEQIQRQLKLPPRTVRPTAIDSLPRNANGKIDYRGLEDGY